MRKDRHAEICCGCQSAVGQKRSALYLKPFSVDCAACFRLAFTTLKFYASMLSLTGPSHLLCAGMRLRYSEWGKGPEVVLLLHDVGESGSIWCPVALRLAELGYHVFALDLRGIPLFAALPVPICGLKS